MTDRAVNHVNALRRRASVAQQMKFGLALCCTTIVGCAPGEKNRTSVSLDQSAAPAAGQSQPISNTDPCAMHLHDIGGGFLLYYATHGRLPPSLDALRSVPGLDAPGAMACPVSNQPYLYTPDGILMPEQGWRIILVDPAPSHSRMRWAIRLEEPAPNQPLLVRVVALPESFFLLRPPQ